MRSAVSQKKEKRILRYMFTIQIKQVVKDEKGLEREVTIYQQSVENLDLEGVIGKINGLEKPKPEVKKE